MNYRHQYHAGNRADVIKHLILIALLSHLKKKETPFTFIDTHAGKGIYDLTSIEANKTEEYYEGIFSIKKSINKNPLLETYLEMVFNHNQNLPELQFYPGSPLIAHDLLRPQDKMIVNELHPEEYQALRKLLGTKNQVAIHQRDAYEFLPAVIPPQTKRGLVLIDPPFEKPEEINQLENVLKKSWAKWSQGIYLIWLPIKDKNWQAFYDQLKTDISSKILVNEFEWLNPNVLQQKLSGSSLLIINPPWLIEEQIKDIAAILMSNWRGLSFRMEFI